MVHKEQSEGISEEKAWAKARGEALLKNLDFIDVLENVRASLTELAEKHEVNDEALIEWFMREIGFSSTE